METVIGLNLNHHDTCLFTKSVGGEGLSDLNKFIYETLQDAVQLVALRLEDRRSSRYLRAANSDNDCRGVSIRNDECVLAYDERISTQR